MLVANKMILLGFVCINVIVGFPSADLWPGPVYCTSVGSVPLCLVVSIPLQVMFLAD